jgi:hypothetical protein
VDGGFEAGVNPGNYSDFEAGSGAVSNLVAVVDRIDYMGGHWQHTEGGRSLDVNGTPGVGGIKQTLLMAATNSSRADENFESSTTTFSYAATRVSYIINDASAAHSGAYSFRVNRSSCGASCFLSYRVDLTHDFGEPVHLIGIGLWALEASTSGSGWGGKIRVGHNGTWNLFDSGYDWWGVVGNNRPVTGEWSYQYVKVDEVATDARIQLWDITSRSTLWIDDVVFYYNVGGVVRTAPASWGSIKSAFQE